MAQLIKALRDIALYEPGGSLPVPMDFSECCVASALWSKSMRVVAELGFKVGLKDEVYNFLHQFIRPDWHAQWSLLPVLFFRDIGSSCWKPLVPLISQCFNDGINFLH